VTHLARISRTVPRPVCRVAPIESVVVCPSLLVGYGVQAFQFDSGICGRELSVGSEVLFVALMLPGGHLAVHFLHAVKPAADALSGQNAELHLRHVQPTAVTRRMHHPQPARESMSRLCIEGRVQAGDVVRVEVV
jgi:hypothetical protein